MVGFLFSGVLKQHHELFFHPRSLYKGKKKCVVLLGCQIHVNVKNHEAGIVQTDLLVRSSRPRV